MIFKRKILVSITGSREKDWQEKLKEIEKSKIKEIALFLEIFEKEQREKIYRALLQSKIKSIPLVHIRDDMARAELIFLKKNFKAKYFTIHENNFVQHDVESWRGFYKDLCLEMDYDNFVSKKVEVEKIGGFCIDLAHFKAGTDRLNKDFEYVYNKRKTKKYFKCNHVNGYDSKTSCDMHTIKDFKDFDYLKSLPKWLFGKIIAIECFNPIEEQIEFKKYLSKILKV